MQELFQIRPVWTTCAYRTDTYREIERRECASRFAASARFCVQFCLKGGYQGGRISDARMRAEMGPPWKVCQCLLMCLLPQLRCSRMAFCTHQTPYRARAMALRASTTFRYRLPRKAWNWAMP